MPYPNEHALRLKDPAGFDKDTFKRTHGSGKGQVQGVKIPANVDVIWGKLKGKAEDDDPPIAQALRFPISKWGKEPDKAKEWIKDKELKGTFEKAEPKEENAIEGNELHVFVSLAGETFRYETWQGRQQLVVPVVGLVEGVHNGIFYPGDEIANYIEAWNGVPVPIFHPKDMENGVPVSCNDPLIVESQCVGRLWNVQFDPDGAKLRGEIWIDVEQANRINTAVIAGILNGEKMEVSTGLWGDHVRAPGDWNGESYEYVLRNYRPDHIALLPGELGACSWTDGCGIRVNEIEKKEVEMPQKGKTIASKDKRIPLVGEDAVVLALAEKLKLKTNELSHEDIRWALQDALGGMVATPAPTSPIMDVWVREVYNDFFVYEASTGGKTSLFKQGYKVTNDDVAFDGDPAEVEVKVEYVELHKKQVNNKVVDEPAPVDNKDVKEDLKLMDKDKIITAMIENEDLPYAEEDREWLSKLEENQLEKMKGVVVQKKEEPAPKDEPAPKNEPVVDNDADDDDQEPSNAAPTPDEFISNAPTEIQEVLQSGLAMHRERKAGLVKGIMANKRNKFTEDQLKAKSMEELVALAELASVETHDYKANRPAQIKEPAKNERHEDGTGVPDMPKPVWVNGKPDYSHLK